MAFRLQSQTEVHCDQCGALHLRVRRRDRNYCSARCRQRAFRARKADPFKNLSFTK